MPVDVPPLKTIELVVVFPALVTVWKLPVVPDGQLVPSARQTFCPFTVVLAGRMVAPRTINVLLTVNNPVDVPPANWMVLVVVLPAFVTDWNVPLPPPPGGQFVPSARQTFFPPIVEPFGNCAKPETNKFVDVTFVPVALVNVMPWSEVVPVTVRLDVLMPPYAESR